MRQKTLTGFLLGTALSLLPLTTSAQDAGALRERIFSFASENTLAAAHLRRLEKPEYRPQFTAMLIEELFRVDPGGQVTQESVDLRLTMGLAQQRAQQLSRLLVWDLNGDGQIDATERSRFFGQGAAGVETAFANGDADRDGTLSFAELSTLAEADLSQHSRAAVSSVLMVFDFDQDGVVNVEDISRTMDALGDEPLGLANVLQRQDGARLQYGLARRQQTASRCNAPKPSAASQFVVVSGYEGAALSTVAVSGRDDVTHVATIEVEPGETPVFLLLGAYGTIIWDVTGATDRIEAVVTQGGGVLGLPKEKVHFVPRNGCFAYVSSVEGSKGAAAYREAEQSFGRAPNSMFARYTISQIAVPSGTAPPDRGDGNGADMLVIDGKRFEVTPEGLRPLDDARDQLPGPGPYGAAGTLRSLLRFNPGGLREVDAEDVVSATEAEPYDIYPQQAGLLQLVLDGRARFTRDGVYLIEQEIPRFPAGLNGAHSVRFMLGEGVAMPGGSPGHSSVFSAETGKCLISRCMR